MGYKKGYICDGMEYRFANNKLYDNYGTHVASVMLSACKGYATYYAVQGMAYTRIHSAPISGSSDIGRLLVEQYDLWCWDNPGKSLSRTD